MSSRKHFHRSERYECGQSASCRIVQFAPIIAAGISAGAGYLSSRQQARNARSAMRNQAAYAQPRMWVSAQPHARSVLSGAQQLASQGLFAPGPNPHELWAREQLAALEPYQYRLGGAFRHRLRQALTPTKSPYVDQMVKQTRQGLFDQYVQDVLPQIRGQAQSVGGFGGSRQGVAEGLAWKGLQRTSGEIENKIRQQGYQQALAQQRAAFQHIPSAYASFEQPAATRLRIAAMERGDQMRQVQNLLGYQGAVSPYTTQFPGASGYPPQYGQDNPWTGALQGAATGLGIYGHYRQLQNQQFRGGGYNPSMGGGTLSGPGF